MPDGLPHPPRRLAPLSEESLSAAQKAALAAVVAARGRSGGPYDALLRVPDLAIQVLSMGDTIRFGPQLEPRLAELAIVTTVHHWGASFAWRAHAPLALEAGIPRSALEAIAAGRSPTDLAADAAAVHRFASDLVARGRVDDQVADALRDQLGEAGVVAVTATVGFYCLISFVLNVDRPPDDRELAVPER